MASFIIWPKKYLPGTTDNFVSNEVFAAGITAEQIWPFLSDITKWESYYDNVSQITPPITGPTLKKDDKFSFSTFGLAPLQAEVWECVPPSATSPGRLAWRAYLEGDEDTAIDVYHAWVIENSEWGVVRILTQESQIGKPMAKLKIMKPNPMLNAHQDWLDGLVKVTEDSVL